MTADIIGAASDARRAVALAFACNFLLLGSYYILRPVRDTVATIFGVDSVAAPVHRDVRRYLHCLRDLYRACIPDQARASSSRACSGFGFATSLYLWCSFGSRRKSLAGRNLLRLVQRRQSIHDFGFLESDGGCLFRRTSDPCFRVYRGRRRFGRDCRSAAYAAARQAAGFERDAPDRGLRIRAGRCPRPSIDVRKGAGARERRSGSAVHPRQYTERRRPRGIEPGIQIELRARIRRRSS